MNLGPIELLLLRRLREQLGDGIRWQRGPVQRGAASGLLPEVFVHAARFEDPGAGASPAPARWPLTGGWREERPAFLELELTCQCGQHAQAQQLAGMLVGPALETLNRLRMLELSDTQDRARRLRLVLPRAALLRCTSGGAGAKDEPAQQQLLFRVSGLLQIEMQGAESLQALDPHAAQIRLQIDADPAGVDLQAERVRLSLADGEPTLSLGGWCLRDAAGHRYRFAAGLELRPGSELSLWTRRGKDDGRNLFWGRRKAVWNNSGDLALLLDADGVERARASWQPPLPQPR